MEPAAPLASSFTRGRPGWRELALGVAAAGVLVLLALLPPVCRGPGFHHYADERAWLGLPNAADVLTNLPFVLVGLAGLALAPRVPARDRLGVRLLFGGFVLLGLGSGAYHLYRTDLTLVLDWLPIALVLAWLSALVITDRVGARAGRVAGWILPAAAVASVLVWWLGGGTAGGDMRWYVGLQLSLVAAVPVIVLLYPRGALGTRELWLAVACFGAARVVNKADGWLLDHVGLSGHSCKHLVAGLAAYFVLCSVRRAAR